MRINKLLSNAGICSRKEANSIIEQGRVTVNGEPCIPGKWVEWEDDIRLDGVPVEKAEMVYILYNKPVGVLCTLDKSIKDNLLEHMDYDGYVFPVGRLDKESEGLLLLTNDGDLADKVLRAEYEHQKEYIVEVDKVFDDSFISTLSGGVEIFGQMTMPCDVYRINENTFRIILVQGINRQIRKMCKKFGYNVTSLKRIRIVNLSLEGILEGSYRHATNEEIKKLQEITFNWYSIFNIRLTMYVYF